MLGEELVYMLGFSQYREAFARAVIRGMLRIANSGLLLLLTVLAVFWASVLAYALIEHHGPITSAWWAVVTGSTTGYGDQYPETTAGRGIGAFLMVMFWLLAPLIGAFTTARLVEDRNVFTHEEQEALKRDLQEARDDLRETTKLLRLVVDNLNTEDEQKYVADSLGAIKEKLGIAA